MNKKFFKKILADYQKYNEMREIVIRNSRQVLKLSKQAIFNLHRDEIKQASEDLNQAEKILIDLSKLFTKEKKLNYEGSYKEGVEEYIEAQLFYGFVVNNKVEVKSTLKFSFDDYLGGISDLTGEMLRKAIQLATKGEYQKLELYHQTLEYIMGELIKFNLTRKLRMKYDAAKRNLRRLEEIRYEIEIKGLNKKS